jgi:hypothetical protein
VKSTVKKTRTTTKKVSAPAIKKTPKFSVTSAKVALAKSLPTPTIGTDPEFFIQNEDHKPIPADLVLGAKPGIVGSAYDSFNGEWKVIVDNACGEFTTPVGHCLQELNGDIGLILQEIFASKLYPKHDFLISPAVEFDEEILEKSKTAHIFGCAPSFVRMPDGTVRQSAPKISPNAIPIRSAGYHLHLGNPGYDEYEEDDRDYYTPHRQNHFSVSQSTVNKAISRIFRTPEGQLDLVQTCDLMIGLPSVLFERQYEQGRWRRMTLGYGRAGEFRLPKHGFEYRTLSMWPLSSPVWTWWAHCAIRDAYRVAAAGLDLHKGIDMAAVAEAIDQHKFELASELWTTVRKRLWRLTEQKLYPQGNNVAFSQETLKGMEFIMAHGGFLGHVSKNFVVEWGLLPEIDRDFHSDESIGYCRGFPSFVSSRISNDKRWSKFNTKWRVNSNNVKNMVVT